MCMYSHVVFCLFSIVSYGFTRFGGNVRLFRNTQLTHMAAFVFYGILCRPTCKIQKPDGRFHIEAAPVAPSPPLATFVISCGPLRPETSRCVFKVRKARPSMEVSKKYKKRIFQKQIICMIFEFWEVNPTPILHTPRNVCFSPHLSVDYTS